MITLSKFGWSAKVFEVIEWHFVSDGNPPQLAIEMTMRETASSVYDWTVDDQENMADAAPTTLPDPFTLSAPTNLTLTADGTTQLIQADGTALPRIKVAWSAPSEQFIQSGGQVIIEYKQGNATTYLTWSKINGDQVIDYISSDVRIGTTYDVRIYGQSYFGVSTSYVTAGVTVAKDTTAPAAPTSLTASVGTGKAVSLDWDDNTEPDLSEYGVYRNTTGVTPANASTNKIAEVRASRFVDTEVSIGTTYWYWVNAYDALENVSGFSAAVTAVPTYVSGGSVDPNAPTTPAAPQYVSETTYLASDGGAFARISLTAPPLSANAIATDILYRRSGANDWILGNQINSAVSYLVSIDDLTCGVTYEFASRAISNFGVLSSVSTTISRMAPNKSATPSAPTGIAASKNGVAPNVLGSTGVLRYGSRITWSAPSDKDIAYYEIKATSSDSDGATDYAWDDGRGTAALYRTDLLSFTFYNTSLVAGYVRVRAIDRTGNGSSWLRYGNINDSAVATLAAGNMTEQSASNVQVTGFKTGGGSSTRQVNVRYEVSEVKSLTGGSTTETINVDTTNRGFSAKPDAGWIQCASDSNIVGVYDFDNVSNSSTTSYFNLRTVDGTNVPAGNQRFSIQLVDYS